MVDLVSRWREPRAVLTSGLFCMYDWREACAYISLANRDFSTLNVRGQNRMRPEPREHVQHHCKRKHQLTGYGCE